MARKELEAKMHDVLEHSGHPRSALSPKHVVEHPVCKIGYSVPVILFQFVSDVQSQSTIQHIAALSVPNHPPVFSVGQENEAAKDVAGAALKRACTLYECDGTPQNCLFKKHPRVRSDSIK